jgi:hypothetical protein
MCAEGALDAGAQAKLLEAVNKIEMLGDGARLAELMIFDGAHAAHGEAAQ